MSDDYYDPELEAEQAALAEQLNELLVTRQQLQSQTQALQGDVGSFRREQQLAWDAAHAASVELATAQGGDFYAPDVGQQVAPDGTVTYDFDAHLHARGVDIDVGLTSTPPNDRRIRWLRADGGVVAQLFAYQDAQFVEGNLITTPDNGARLSQISGLYIGATDVISARALVTNPAKAPATQTRTIIDDTGASNFVQSLTLVELLAPGRQQRPARPVHAQPALQLHRRRDRRPVRHPGADHPRRNVVTGLGERQPVLHRCLQRAPHRRDRRLMGRLRHPRLTSPWPQPFPSTSPPPPTPGWPTSPTTSSPS
jgi:hypothetical protein